MKRDAVPVMIVALFFSSYYVVAQTKDPKPALEKLKPKEAHADMQSKSGSAVKGTVHFSEGTQGLEISYDFQGLTKGQKYGFHIHENGDCSSADAKSAGKHYHEVAKTGGTSLDNPQRYAGDLPQITADASGNAKGSVKVSQLTIDKKIPIENRAIILHGGPDDITKKSAPRVACGVIKTIKE